MRGGAFILMLSFAALAQAQGEDGGITPKSNAPSPDERWELFPSGPDAGTAELPEPVPALEAPPPPPPPAPPPPASPPPRVTQPPVPEEFNDVSIYGAPTLGQWKRGIGAFMGFPLVEGRFAIGLLDRLDLGIAFDTLWGVMNDFRLHGKYQFLADKNWSGALVLEGGPAFFTQTPQEESHGARWLTGRRDWNLAPGVVFSYRGNTPHSPRLFTDVRYALAFDTEPFAREPLGGTPASVQVNSNVDVRAGAEMPFSAKTSFLFVFGFDVHGNNNDSAFMLDVAIGLVTSL